MLALDVADEDDEDGESEQGDDDGGGSSVQSEAEASVDPSLSWGQRRSFPTTWTMAPSPEAGRVDKKWRKRKERRRHGSLSGA